MQTTYFNKDNLDTGYINKILKNGGVIAFPTETVYGLGAFISNEQGLKKIYTLKHRSENKPLTVHIGNISQAKLVAKDLPPAFFKLAEQFLPGPLTIIVKKQEGVSSLVSPFDTVGIRIPSHPLTLKLLKEIENPIVGTSANESSLKSSVSAVEVLNSFENKIDCIIDGGLCDIGLPSTIVDLTDQIKILRNGFITKDQIENALKIKI